MKTRVWVWACISAEISFAQVSAKIDFARDVQPLFRQHCLGCHGPAQQMNGFRLDQRRYVIPNRVGANGAAVAPGDSAKSLLYLKLTGNKNGPQMPPAGPLAPEQIAIVKAWIDQGAEWPDSLSGETPLSAPDPAAARLMEAIRSGDRQMVRKLVRRNPKAIHGRGPGGSTPLMYAALYGGPDLVQLLLERGADPNLRNDAGATALMWAVEDPETTRLLLRHGADAKAHSADGQTPLMIAAGHFGSGAAVAKLLLDAGANPSERAPNGNTPLTAAAFAADNAVIELLIARGADAKRVGVYAAARAGCGECVATLIRAAEGKAPKPAVPTQAFAHPDALKLLLDRGAEINVQAGGGRTRMTGLMFASISDAFPLETVRDLIERGADVNLKNSDGLTALDLARKLGDSPVAALLLKAGAKAGSASAEPAAVVPQPKPAASPRAAIARSLPLLQHSDVTFVQKSGCVSCHNNNLTAMAVAAAGTNGIPVDGETARKQLQTIASYLETWRERLLQGIAIPGNQDTVSYLLLGMAAANYAPDAATDAAARYLKGRQGADGHWWVQGPRSPLESSDIQVTAVSMRAIQVYAPRTRRAEYAGRVQLAAAWLAKAEARTTEDRAFQLLGLSWAKAGREMIRKAAGELLAGQRADGGWGQIPSLAPDAYATGQALAALHESGALAVTDAAYQRGARFLLNTQLEDGSWYVKSRSLAFQPYFESGFPHGHDQWISAAATNWAVMALAPAAR